MFIQFLLLNEFRIELVMNKMKNNLHNKFSRLLLKWDKEKNVRVMPWKNETDPYKIWLSEIILQQTRVEQGLAYYKNFVETFPDINKLAKSKDGKIMKLWEGLGYYSRCRNLISTARQISNEKKGIFPQSYEEIILLKGVGPYTAAAISSFAFNLPHAVLDGNVFRVLARVFGIETAIDSTIGKKEFTQLADLVLDKKNPGKHNQAIMDFGAVVCKPMAPLCNECIFKNQCIAYQANRIKELPFKEKKLIIKNRHFNFLVLNYKTQVLINQRKNKDIWQNLYEFPMIETSMDISKSMMSKTIIDSGILCNEEFEIENISPIIKQQLTHQLINGRFINIKLMKKSKQSEWKWVDIQKLNQFSFPKIIHKYFEFIQKLNDR